MNNEPKAGSAPVEKAGEVDFELAHEWAMKPLLCATAIPTDRETWTDEAIENAARAYLALSAEVETLQYERDCHIRGASELKAELDGVRSDRIGKDKQIDALRAGRADIDSTNKREQSEWHAKRADLGLE